MSLLARHVRYSGPIASDIGLSGHVRLFLAMPVTIGLSHESAPFCTLDPAGQGGEISVLADFGFSVTNLNRRDPRTGA